MATVSTDPGITATISAPTNGTGGLDKEGPGTLVLSGTNAYSGGTKVGAGILSVASETNLGNAAGVITLQNGELLTAADGFSSVRPITLAAALGDDALVAANGTTATYTGDISGPAGLTIGDGVNGSTVVLTGRTRTALGTPSSRDWVPCRSAMAEPPAALSGIWPTMGTWSLAAVMWSPSLVKLMAQGH